MVRRIAQVIRNSGLPQEGLVPLGGTGLLITPNTPADPRDCNRYPDSIYCGGNPLTLQPLGLNPGLFIDNCSLNLTFTPVIAFVKLPQTQILYQFPDCRKPTPPIPPPGTPSSTYFPPSCSDKSRVLMVILCTRTSSVTTSTGGSASVKTVHSIKEIKYPADPNFSSSQYGKAVITVRSKGYMVTTRNNQFKRTQGLPITAPDVATNEKTDDFITSLYERSPGNRASTYYDVTASRAGLHIMYGTLADIKALYGTGSYIVSTSPFETLTQRLDYQVLFSTCPPGIFPPPPPKPPKKRCRPMNCCCSPNQDPDSDLLLRQVLKKLEGLDKKVGDFPATVPESLISERQSFLGNLLPQKTIQINSHVEMWDWMVRRFDEIVGQLKIYIEVKDADPTKPGDQPQGIVLPNFAEAIAEMFGLLLQISINSETATTLLIKILVESGAAKQQGFTNFSYVKAIADYLNFKREDKTAPIQLSFTPNSDSLENFIKEAKVNADIVELDDDEQDFNVALTKLLRSASIIDSVYLKKFEKGSDIAKQIVELVTNRAKAYEDFTKKDKETENTNWNQFLESVEMGHINSSGISDSTNPYGVPFEERPRIKELGIEQIDAD